MKRREFLDISSATLLALAFPWGRAEAAEPIRRHVRPSDPEWPSPAHWEKLRNRVHGRLVQPVAPAEGPQARNPFWLEEQPGATQSTGWVEAWESHPSAYAVAAQSAQDVAAAVDFARDHRLRLVVKGTGHDYLGRSNAADSLLVWTHPMRQVTVHERFVPQGAPGGHPAIPAVSAQAGTRWLEVYDEVTTRHGRYVQGGGCASVGAAGGFPQGGGFGSFSKKFGTGAAGMVEVEVVTSDGRILTANEFQHPDLFWALRGGGGGTFGIVTRITLMTHDLPETFGSVSGTIRARDDDDYRSLVERLRRFYCEALNNEHWGEQIALRPDNAVEVFVTFQGLTQEQAAQVWEPLTRAWDNDLQVLAIPARDMWNLSFWKANHPDHVTPDPRQGPDGRVYWWSGNQGEVSMYWYTYQSRYIPLRAMQDPGFTETLFQASRHWRTGLHLNKGLAGAPEEALRRGRQTSVNPVVETAAALAILGAGRQGGPPDFADARQAIERVDAAMKLLREATPESGSYANEADYFTQDWQREFWGVHYPRLLEIKQRYDPVGLFHVHHGVGSEGWSRDGMTRA